MDYVRTLLTTPPYDPDWSESATDRPYIEVYMACSACRGAGRVIFLSRCPNCHNPHTISPYLPVGSTFPCGYVPDEVVMLEDDATWEDRGCGRCVGKGRVTYKVALSTLFALIAPAAPSHAEEDAA